MQYPRAAELILSFVIAFVAISYFFQKERRFEEFALGKGTSSFFATHDSLLIHTDKLTESTRGSMINGWTKRGKHPVVLCLGNSQTHGINQKKEGDVSYNKIFLILWPLMIWT